MTTSYNTGPDASYEYNAESTRATGVQQRGSKWIAPDSVGQEPGTAKSSIFSDFSVATRNG